jgi:hypothetical protein
LENRTIYIQDQKYNAKAVRTKSNMASRAWRMIYAEGTTGFVSWKQMVKFVGSGGTKIDQGGLSSSDHAPESNKTDPGG